MNNWNKGDRVRVVDYQDEEAIGCVGTVAYKPSSEANPVLRVIVDKDDAERIYPGIVAWELNATANEHFVRIDANIENGKMDLEEIALYRKAGEFMGYLQHSLGNGSLMMLRDTETREFCYRWEQRIFTGKGESRLSAAEHRISFEELLLSKYLSMSAELVTDRWKLQMRKLSETGE